MTSALIIARQTAAKEANQLPVCSKVVKCKFQPQKVPIDISEKNETKVMHRMELWIELSNRVMDKCFSGCYGDGDVSKCPKI